MQLKTVFVPPQVEQIGQTEFTFRILFEEEVISLASKLRYQVYCNECGYLNPQDYPSEMELDEYDEVSVHFGIFVRGSLVGYARLIPVEADAPVWKYIPQEDKAKISISSAVEISRLVISKRFRRRASDGLYYEVDSYSMEAERLGRGRTIPMIYGLYRLIYTFSKECGIDWWLALMEPTLFRLLKKTGVEFRRLGDVVEYMGKVYPYALFLPNAEEKVKRENPQFYEYFSKYVNRNNLI